MNISPKTLILGVGNILLKDEGIGIHTIKALENESLPSHIKILDGGTGGLHLIHWLQDYEHIIMIDATLDNQSPGSIRLIRPHFASDFPPLMSAHEIGIKDMINAMILTGLHPDIHLITISVADIQQVSMELTPSVAAAIPKVIQLIKQLIKEPGLSLQTVDSED